MSHAPLSTVRARPDRIAADAEFAVLGYPGIAMAFHLAAATGGTFLLRSIFRQDR